MGEEMRQVQSLTPCDPPVTPCDPPVTPSAGLGGHAYHTLYQRVSSTVTPMTPKTYKKILGNTSAVLLGSAAAANTSGHNIGNLGSQGSQGSRMGCVQSCATTDDGQGPPKSLIQNGVNDFRVLQGGGWCVECGR